MSRSMRHSFREIVILSPALRVPVLVTKVEGRKGITSSLNSQRGSYPTVNSLSLKSSRKTSMALMAGNSDGDTGIGIT
jgi:hypothetical protein